MKMKAFFQRLFHRKHQTQASRWRERNRHNETFLLSPVLDIDRVSVGKGTYGPLTVECAGGTSRLQIGNYCSIGPKVCFILASEHPYQGISTYPFKVKLNLQPMEALSKGDIVVEDDVWICLGAVINSGVHIGRGAIIASGSVVVKDVEPYSIVGGNPAKHLKYRFDASVRQKLQALDFSKLDLETVKKNIDRVYEPLTQNNVDEILHILTQEHTGVNQ